MDTTRQRKIAAAIGARLARKRQDAGMTQEEVAEHLEVGNEAVSRMERGVAAPTVARLFEFAELYGCRVDQLLLESSDREIDQAAMLINQLSGLAPSDRLLVSGIVDQLISHLRKKSNDKRKH